MGPNVRRLIDLIKRYLLHRRRVDARNWLMLAERGMLDEDIAEVLLFRVHVLILEQERRWNALERAPTLDELYPNGEPDLIIGQLQEASDVPLGLFPRGPFFACFAGTTGSGKTVAIRRLVMAIEELNRRRSRPLVVLVFDYKGTSYLDFPELFGPHWRYYEALGQLRLGLQPPDGVASSMWINYITNCFCARCGLVAAQVTMANLMRWLVGVMNSNSPEMLLFPDFQLMLDVAYQLPKTAFASKTQYLESLIQYLAGVTQASGELFRTFNGLDLERDLIREGQSAVFSMANLSPPFLNQFIADVMVLQLLIGRMARGYRRDDPDVLLVFDDCDSIVSHDNERQFQTAMPPITQCARQGRELGIGLALGFGALGPVCEQILNGMSHHFFFRSPHDDCANAAKRALGLPQGSQNLIQALLPGECVAKIPSRWSHGMLCRIDYVPSCQYSRPALDANKHVPAKDVEDLPVVKDAIQQLVEQHERTKGRQARQKYAALRHDTRQLLFQASGHPSLPTARLFEMMEPLTPPARKAVLDQLDAGDYADVTKIRVGSKTHYLLELLEPAWQLFGKPAVMLKGRGGTAHRTFQSWIVMVGRQKGYEAECEWVVPGTTHPTDAAWKVGDRWRVFEVVVTSDGNLTDAIHAALFTPATPVESVTVVAPTLHILKKLKTSVASCSALASVKDRIDFEPVAIFESELWP